MGGMARALFGDQVKAAPPVAFRLQPVLRHQTKDAGAQQAFIDAQGGQELDQAAQPDGAAVRGQGVAQQADAQRFRARRIAFQ
ncbi:hypothetical protein D3C72_1846630 [compost metagenome]